MASITVSVADKHTIDGLLASVVELFREDAGTHDPTTDISWPVREGADYYAGLLDDPGCLLLIARSDVGTTVGHLVGKLREPTTLQPVRLAVLESIRVAPEVRGSGVGSRLVDQFFGWARDRAAAVASVSAYANNTRAQRFYQRQGFAPQTLTLRSVVPIAADQRLDH